MQTRNRIFDDMARVATGALDVASGLREEIEARVRQQLDKMLGDMDLVTREEFDAVRAMAAKARDEQERLTGQVAELEKRLAALEKGGAAKAKTKAAPKADTKTSRSND